MGSPVASPLTYTEAGKPYLTRRGTLFDNDHIKDYPQWHTVSLRFSKRAVPSILREADAVPEAVFCPPASLADIVLDTGMVRSKSALRRLCNANGITFFWWDSPQSIDWYRPLPRRWSIYQVKSGQRCLEIISEVATHDRGQEKGLWK